MTAKERYQQLDSEIDALVAQLQNLKGNHRQDFSQDFEVSWGYVGDLATVKSHLQNAVDCLSESEKEANQ